MTDLYNYVNPKNGRHSPLISKEAHEIIMANADVSEALSLSDLFHVSLEAMKCCSKPL